MTDFMRKFKIKKRLTSRNLKKKWKNNIFKVSKLHK